MNQLMQLLLAMLGAFIAPLHGEVGATLNTSIETAEWAGTTPTIWEEALFHVSTRLSIGDQFATTQRSKESMGGPKGSASMRQVGAIIDKFELTKRAGQTITFSVIAPLTGSGVSVRTALVGNEEEIEASTFDVVTVHNRHAVATDDIAKVVSIVGRKFETVAAELLGDWFARRKDDDWMDEVLNVSTIQSLFAGNASSRANIQPGAYLLPHELRRLAMAAERRGAIPIQTTKTVKSTFPMYCALMSEVDYYNLVNDANFKQDVRLAEVRGADNPAISGRINMYQGMLILRWSSVPASTGFMGSFLRPEARLRTTMTAGQTTVDIGPATQKNNTDYGKYFPASGLLNLLLIDSENLSYTGATTDPSDTGWATVVRAANGTPAAGHTAGALITLNNLGKVLVFGSNLMLRAWSMRPSRITHDFEDYQFEHGRGIRWMYGLKAVVWDDSTVANGVVMETYSSNPNTV